MRKLCLKNGSNGSHENELEEKTKQSRLPSGLRVVAGQGVVVASILVAAATVQAREIATDRFSYLPGEAVIVSGQGWQPNETVSLKTKGAASEPASVVQVSAGAEGDFKQQVYVFQEGDRGQFVTISAQGGSRGDAMVVLRGGTAPGSLHCPSLATAGLTRYDVSPGETVNCSIEGAADLSAAQKAGAEPVDVLVKCSSGVLQPAKVISVAGGTIAFEWTAPTAGCAASTVSYGPVKGCSASGRCFVFPAEGNDSNSNLIPGGAVDAAAGFGSPDHGVRAECMYPAQIAVAKFPKNGAFAEGGEAAYTIVVTNPAPAGYDAADNVQLQDLLPGNGNLVWQSATPSQGWCENPIVSNVLNCNLGPLAPQASATVTVKSAAETPLSACQPQPNPAAIATADGWLTAQDFGSLTCTPLPPAQLKVVVTPDGGTFYQNEQISYTIVVSNPAAPGSGSATNVQLTDPLPGFGGLTWAWVSTTAGRCSVGYNLLSCALGDIQPQGEVKVTVYSTGWTPPEACRDQPTTAAAKADGGLAAQDSGSLTCTLSVPPQLKVVKSPDMGSFTQGSQVSYTMVVSNPAASGAAAARNVQLTDPLTTYGGLTWTSVKTSQGACTLGDGLRCSLGIIPAGGSASVVVTSPATTPATACTWQPITFAMATADGSLMDYDWGSIYCFPSACNINGLSIANTSWNSFKIPEGSSPVVWVHAHIGKPAGIPKSLSSLTFTGGRITFSNGISRSLPEGQIIFDPAATRSSTRFDTVMKRWVTTVNSSDLSDEIFVTGAPIPVTPSLAEGAKATLSFNVSSQVPQLSFSWQWSAAVYTKWPADNNDAAIQSDHRGYHAGAPTNTTVQQSLIQGPRGGAGSNFTGSWSATGDGVCKGGGGGIFLPPEPD